MITKTSFEDKVKVGFYIDRKYLVHIALIVAKRMNDKQEVVRKSHIVEEALDLLYKQEMGK